MPLQTTFCTMLLLTVLYIPHVHSVFFYYGKRAKHDKSEIYIMDFDNMEIKLSQGQKNLPPGQLGGKLPVYRNISNLYSVDERCDTGLPLSMQMYEFSPYLSDSVEREMVKVNVTVNGTVKTKPVQNFRFVFFGVFPKILKKAIPTCCHPQTDIRYAKLIFEQYAPTEVDPADEWDLTFPLYGESMESTMYKSNPFIPIIQAPSVVLLVDSESIKTRQTPYIAITILNIWPLFLFILLISFSAGITMWCLDRFKNEEQFPKPFINGAWEGFWWSFITMTTVGYGDRTPKSFLGRFFCILWIIFGVVIISVLSGLITTVFSASAKEHFTIHGAKIGAVVGSEEFRFGLSLNADMHEFKTNARAFAAVQHYKTMSGVLIDNYVANYFGEQIINADLRIRRRMDHAITYGIRMAKGSEKLEKCIKKYLHDHPQEVFDMFSKSLTTFKNPKDRENVRHTNAQKLFKSDSTMDKVRVYGACFVGGLLFFGLFWQGLMYIIKRRKERPSKFTHHVVSDIKWSPGSLQDVDSPLKELLDQYNCFQDGWVKKMKAIHQE